MGMMRSALFLGGLLTAAGGGMAAAAIGSPRTTSGQSDVDTTPWEAPTGSFPVVARGADGNPATVIVDLEKFKAEAKRLSDERLAQEPGVTYGWIADANGHPVPALRCVPGAADEVVKAAARAAGLDEELVAGLSGCTKVE